MINFSELRSAEGGMSNYVYHWSSELRRGRTRYVHDETGEVWRRGVWLQHFEREKAKPYYEHTERGVTTWDAPEWVDVWDGGTQKPYYVHTATGGTQWEAPAGWCPLVLGEMPSASAAEQRRRAKKHATPSGQQRRRAQQSGKGAGVADANAMRRAELEHILRDVAAFETTTRESAGVFGELASFVHRSVEQPAPPAR